MKRSNMPILWSLFGAGGMLAALTGAGLVFVTGIAAPLGLFQAPELLQYEHILAFCQGAWGKLVVFTVVTLFLWHAALRIFHLLHDFGIGTRRGSGVVCFGIPLLGTIAAAYWLLILGF